MIIYGWTMFFLLSIFAVIFVEELMSKRAAFMFSIAAVLTCIFLAIVDLRAFLLVLAACMFQIIGMRRINRRI